MLAVCAIEVCLDCGRQLTAQEKAADRDLCLDCYAYPRGPQQNEK